MSPEGVVADGQTDNHAVVQQGLDAAGSSADKAVVLPPGNIAISKPLVVRHADTRLRGARDGRTRLFGTFAGHLVVAQKDRPFGPTFGESLVPGPGQSLRLRQGGHQKSVVVTTEPGLQLNGLAELTCRYFFRRLAPAPQQGVHVFLGGYYGHKRFQSFGVWDWFGGLKLYWGTTAVDIPGVTQEVGPVYYVEVTLRAGAVSVWVGEAGQPAELVRTFSPPVTAFTQIGGAAEVLCLGHDVNGPLGDLAAWGGPDALIDGFELAGAARHAGDFTCPAVKPTPDGHTRLLLNFETEGPFVKGWGYQNATVRPSYILPPSDDAQMGGVEVSDLTFMGQSGASGPLLCDVIYGRLERLNVIQSHTGYTLRGTTFGGRYEDLTGNAQAFAFVQGTQSMMTLADRIMVGTRLPGSITAYVHGSVGGHYRGLYLTPHAPVTASLFVSATYDLNIDSGQIDDEGQAGDVGSVVILDGAWVKMYGVLLTRHTPGAVIDCARGGFAHLDGSWLLSQQGTEPQIRFRDPPPAGKRFTLAGCQQVPTAIQLTDHPEWIGVLDAV